MASPQLSALILASSWLLVNAPVEARDPEPACVHLLRLLVRDNRITDPSGEAIAAGQTAAMHQALFEMGFSNYAQYQKFLDQQSRFGRLTDVLRHERVEFAIHAPEAHRDLIAQDGYQRLTEARLREATDPQDPNAAKRGRNYLETRDRSEALHTNIPYFEKYKYLPSSPSPDTATCARSPRDCA